MRKQLVLPLMTAAMLGLLCGCGNRTPIETTTGVAGTTMAATTTASNPAKAETTTAVETTEDSFAEVIAEVENLVEAGNVEEAYAVVEEMAANGDDAASEFLSAFDFLEVVHYSDVTYTDTYGDTFVKYPGCEVIYNPDGTIASIRNESEKESNEQLYAYTCIPTARSLYTENVVDLALALCESAYGLKTPYDYVFSYEYDEQNRLIGITIRGDSREIQSYVIYVCTVKYLDESCIQIDPGDSYASYKTRYTFSNGHLVTQEQNNTEITYDRTDDTHVVTGGYYNEPITYELDAAGRCVRKAYETRVNGGKVNREIVYTYDGSALVGFVGVDTADGTEVGGVTYETVYEDGKLISFRRGSTSLSVSSGVREYTEIIYEGTVSHSTQIRYLGN